MLSVATSTGSFVCSYLAVVALPALKSSVNVTCGILDVISLPFTFVMNLRKAKSKLLTVFLSLTVIDTIFFVESIETFSLALANFVFSVSTTYLSFSNLVATFKVIFPSNLSYPAGAVVSANVYVKFCPADVIFCSGIKSTYPPTLDAATALPSLNVKIAPAKPLLGFSLSTFLNITLKSPSIF